MYHMSTLHWAHGISSVLVMQRIVYEERNDFHFCNKLDRSDDAIV